MESKNKNPLNKNFISVILTNKIILIKQNKIYIVLLIKIKLTNNFKNLQIAKIYKNNFIITHFKI